MKKDLRMPKFAAVSKAVLAVLCCAILILISFLALKANSLSDAVAQVLTADKDQAVWVASQIQYQTIDFELTLREAEFRLPIVIDQELSTKFAVLYSRLGQVLERPLIDILTREKRRYIADQIIDLRMDMASVFDADGQLSKDDVQSIIASLQKTHELWNEGLQLALQDTVDTKTMLRQTSAETIESARNYLLGSLIILILTSIAALASVFWKARANKFQKLAMTDTLTGCLSRFGMEEAFRSDTVRRSDIETAVVVDLNKLKFLNDTYGHATGDLAIQQAAVALQGAIRETDYLARVGGDEFWLLLMTNAATAVKILMRAQQNFSNQPLIIGDKEIPLSFSYGIAFCADHPSVLHAFEAADAEMYREKQEKVLERDFAVI